MSKNLYALCTLLLVGLSVPVFAQPSRTLTFTNQCSFDVWVKSTGSNASNVACSPSTANAQANCPSGFICYEKDANTSYCVAGTTGVTTFPVSKRSDITLQPSTCTSGVQVTDASSNIWGQCTCTDDADCAANQLCQPVVPGVQQCYWGYSLPRGGKLTHDESAQLTIKPGSSRANAIVAGGKFYAKLACDDNGNCLSDNTKGAPATLIEYTFQNDNDWYDVSYINGVNLPATMYPVPAPGVDYQADDPYRCMAAGGDAGTFDAIAKYQQAHAISGNDDLAPFACTNGYDALFTGSLLGFNFVSAETGAAACTKPSDCASGLTCGLTLAAVEGGETATACGYRLGYWTYAQLCAANASYENSGLGVDCAVQKNRAYALCKNLPGVNDTGPARSCFNANTTSSGDTCCGYQEWTKKIGGKSEAQPIGRGDAPVQGVDTSYWKANVLPAVTYVKQECYLAYSYQYDDPYSTFTCATTGAPNATDYQITLCPHGQDAGVSPPAGGTCVAKVPSGYDPDDFVVGLPSALTVTVKVCDAAGACDDALKPSAGSSIFTAEAGTKVYEITATDGSTTQSCKFEIPDAGCIRRVSTSAQCMTWQLVTDGAWPGRDVSVPDF